MQNKGLREIFRERLKAKGLSATEVAVKAGRGRTALNQFLSGRAESPTYANVERYAQAMGYGGIVDLVLDGAAPLDVKLMSDAIVAMLTLIRDREPPWANNPEEVARLIIELYQLQKDDGRDPGDDPQRMAEAMCRGAGLNLPSRRDTTAAGG